MVKDRGHAWFERGDYNLNLVGYRTVASSPTSYSDRMYCAYRVGGEWRLHVWPITTSPGERYLRKPINPAGTAILVPGQYRGAYQLGMHRNDHMALVQRGPVRVWRDGDRDSELDWGEGDGIEGYYGINIHRARGGALSDSPAAASAGCQVFASRGEHLALVDLARESVRRWGGKVTYTLLAG